MVDTKPDYRGVIPVSVAEAGEVARLQAENVQLKEELRREHEMSVRNLADFDNYRRRIERERAQAARAGKRELLIDLLSVMDEFGLMLQQADTESQTINERMRAIHQRLGSMLQAHGVTTFDSIGHRFDPTCHEAISQIKGAEAESGTVIDEIRCGYRWGTELLRPALVRIAQ